MVCHYWSWIDLLPSGYDQKKNDDDFRSKGSLQVGSSNLHPCNMVFDDLNQIIRNMFDAGNQIIKAEGVSYLFKGAGANILRGVAGAGVLSLYDLFQGMAFGKVYKGE
jgi:hypothetical protein